MERTVRVGRGMSAEEQELEDALRDLAEMRARVERQSERLRAIRVRAAERLGVTLESDLPPIRGDLPAE